RADRDAVDPGQRAVAVVADGERPAVAADQRAQVVAVAPDRHGRDLHAGELAADVVEAVELTRAVAAARGQEHQHDRPALGEGAAHAGTRSRRGTRSRARSARTSTAGSTARTPSSETARSTTVTQPKSRSIWMSEMTSTAKPAIAVVPDASTAAPVERYVRSSASPRAWPARRPPQ